MVEGEEENIREVVSQTCIHDSLRVEQVSFALLCHVELDHEIPNFKLY